VMPNVPGRDDRADEGALQEPASQKKDAPKSLHFWEKF